MFSYKAELKPLTLCQTERFWKCSSKGQLIIKFLSSLDETTPSIGNQPRTKMQEPASSSYYEFRDRFMDAGNERLLDIDFANETANQGGLDDSQDTDHRSRLQGVPIEFIKSLCLERAFPPNHEDAGFNLALQALDYLQDLEYTRCDALQEAANNLGITKYNWREVLAGNPSALAWVNNARQWNGGLEICYAELYVGLRIWIMVHELRATPFIRENVLAVLNTLFPPNLQQLPSRIPPKVSHLYRATFYQYVVLVETSGILVFDRYVDKLEMPGNKYTWTKVRACVTDYIKLAGEMIKIAREIYGVEYFEARHSTLNDSHNTSSECPGGQNSTVEVDFKNEYLGDSLSASADIGRVNKEFMRRLSSSSGRSSIDTILVSSGAVSTLSRPPTPEPGSLSRHCPQNSVTDISLPSLTQELEIQSRGNISLEATRKILQEQLVTTLSGRPITSDDVILPGTPLLPDTPEMSQSYHFSVPVYTNTDGLVTGRSPGCNWPSLPHEKLPPRFHPTGNSKTSFKELLKNKLSIRSSSTSRTLHDTFACQGGLGISLGPSKPGENLLNGHPNSHGPGQLILMKQSSVDQLQDAGSVNKSFRSRSGTVWTLRAIDSRSDSLQSESVGQSSFPNSRAAQKIKKKRSLPGIFTKKKASPAIPDSELVYLRTDDNLEQYVLLSELQPLQKISSALCSSVEMLDKIKSCNTLNSAADSQITVDSATRSSRSKKLTKIRSFGTLKSATDSRVAVGSTIPRNRLKKLPRFKPNVISHINPTTPVPVRPWFIARKLFDFNWDPASDDWKSREYIRFYYLKKHRAMRFGSEGPENGPFRPFSHARDEIQRSEVTRATPKNFPDMNSRRRDTISQSRCTPKTPTGGKYTMIDINKYTKPL